MNMTKSNPHVEAYVDFLVSKTDLKRPLKIVSDSSNGPTSMIMRAFAERMRAASIPLDIELMNDEVHPDFPAHGPDPSEPRALAALAGLVREHGADLGVAFDGDGDRAVFVDEKGDPIPSHVIAALLVAETPGTHVADILVYEALTHMDPSLKDRLVPSRVGRYFINQAMHKHQSPIGAELSGHFFFGDFWGADSGILTMVKVLNIITAKGGAASTVMAPYRAHQVLSVKAKLSKPFAEVSGPLKAGIDAKKPVNAYDTDGLSADFGDAWANVRPSNTEPVARVTVGAGTLEKAKALAEELAALFPVA